MHSWRLKIYVSGIQFYQRSSLCLTTTAIQKNLRLPTYFSKLRNDEIHIPTISLKLFLDIFTKQQSCYGDKL